MFLMDTLAKTLFYLFLVGSMMGIGLKVGKAELMTVVRDKGWLLRSLGANFLLIPALGVLAAKLIPMKPENALALILLACAPGGMSALQFLTKTKDEIALAFAGGTAVILSITSVLIAPLFISAALPKGMTLTTPYGTVLLFMALFLLLPLTLGSLIHDKAGSAARKLAKPVALVGTLAFFGFIVKTLALSKEAKSEVGIGALAGIIVFILIAMFVGWLLGGPRPGTRPVLATASSMRFVALTLAIAVRSFPESGVLTPLVAFAAIMIPANLLFMILTKVAGKKAAKQAARTSSEF